MKHRNLHKERVDGQLRSVNPNGPHLTSNSDKTFQTELETIVFQPLNITIWMYWHDGWNQNISIIVQSCHASWENHIQIYNNNNNNNNNNNQTLSQKLLHFEIIQLDKNNVNHYLMDDADVLNNLIKRNHNKLGLAHTADLIRLLLLHRYGGIWVDATLFCNKALESWLVPIITQNIFFVFEKPGGGRLVSNWFIYSKSHSYILSRWLNASLEYISTDPVTSGGNYYWQHKLFDTLLQKDRKLENLWKNTTKLSAIGPHILQHKTGPLGIIAPLTPQLKEMVDQNEQVVLKLTWKINLITSSDASKHYNNTVVNYLFTSHGIHNGMYTGIDNHDVPTTRVLAEKLQHNMDSGTLMQQHLLDQTYTMIHKNKYGTDEDVSVLFLKAIKNNQKQKSSTSDVAGTSAIYEANLMYRSVAHIIPTSNMFNRELWTVELIDKIVSSLGRDNVDEDFDGNAFIQAMDEILEGDN
eukprot:gene6938-9492_t